VAAKPTNFPFWKGLMSVKEECFVRGTFKIGNGLKSKILGRFLDRG
jgi:hypothetical protein